MKDACHALRACSINATIPDRLNDLESFRRWARSDEYPERGHFAFYNGYVWIDVVLEAAASHNQVKAEFVCALLTLNDCVNLGHYFGAGMTFTNTAAGFCTTPDGMFLAHASIASGRVVRVPTPEGDDFDEILGSPDMVLEVVSRSSAKKDCDFIRLYHEAGVPEYWLVDARDDVPRFDLYRCDATAYEAAEVDADGWRHSAVFGRSFRLVRSVNRVGEPKITLETR